MAKQENVVKEPTTTYIHNTEIPTFFGEPMLRGRFVEVDEVATSDAPALFYEHPDGSIWVGDAVAWLNSLESDFQHFLTHDLWVLSDTADYP